MKTIKLNGKSLTIEDINDVVFSSSSNVKVSIDSLTYDKMIKCNELCKNFSYSKKPIYGINTGFGALSNKKINEKDLKTLQLNLIRSHCTGIGKPFNISTTRAIILLRVNCLIAGYSGVSPQIIDLLLDFLNNDVHPVIPEKGSVGASGDLAPLSHLALSLIGEGKVNFNGEIIDSLSAIKSINKTPVTLGPKDGLALINGTAVMAAIASIAVIESKKIMKLADIANCMTLDGIKGTISAYDERISYLKPHKGQIESSKNLLNILEGSKIVESHINCEKVQDPYSLRCAPQVHGACRQTLKHCIEVLKTEINSVTDNPIIFLESKEVISGGNFHGESIALAMDYLSMGISEICSISERRIEKMMNTTFSNLPPFLIDNSGLNSGFMIAHVTAAALASENKYLSHPASIDSIPTSNDKEDHVSMGVTSGRKLLEIIENTKNCLSIEFLCNTQAIEYHRPLQSSPPIENVIKLIRSYVNRLETDRVLYKDIEKVTYIINNNEIIKAIEEKTGPLL